MSVTTTFPFTTPGNYTVASAEITGGKGQLARTAVAANQTETNDFVTPSEYTYDSAKVDLGTGTAAIKDNAQGSTCFATYTSNIDLNYATGSTTGTAVGGAAVSGGKLDLSFNDIRYVTYPAAGNFDGLVQTGCIRFLCTPNYSGGPSGNKTFFFINQAAGLSNNLILLRHQTGGHINVLLNDPSAGTIVNAQLGVWSPTAGTEYEIELNFDVTAGATRLFIDGVQLGSTQTGTGTRSNNIGFVVVGTNVAGTNTSSFKIDNLMAFNSVQHTTNYTPGYSLGETRYDVSNPTIDCDTNAVSVTAINEIVSVAATEVASGSDLVKYAVSTDGFSTFQYWNGSAWATSTSYSQSNTLAEINTNLSSLALTSDFGVRAYLHSADGSTTPSVDDIVITYNKLVYETSGTIVTNTAMQQQAATDFVVSASLPANTDITYALYINGTLRYWDGSAWADSDGSYAQTNTAADIKNNLGTSGSGSVNDLVKPYILLTTSDQTVTPQIDTLSITYDFGGASTAPATCTVWGYYKDIRGVGVSGATISFALSRAAEEYREANKNVIERGASVTTDSTGYFEVELIRTSEYEGTGTYEVTFFLGTELKTSKDDSGTTLMITVPDAVDADITTLLTAV